MLATNAGEKMSRQQAFEAIYAKQNDVPAESLVQYRHKSKDGYNLPGIASHYRTYCLSLDSIVVELPDWFDPDGGGSKAVWLYLLHDALTAAGVKYK